MPIIINSAHQVSLDKIGFAVILTPIGTKLTDYNKRIEMDWEVKEKDNPQEELF